MFATGMGVAMIDFLVREALAVLDGTLLIVRFGTCGTPVASLPIGKVAVATGVATQRGQSEWECVCL